MKRPLQFSVFCLPIFILSLAATAQSVPAGVGSVPNIGFQLPHLGGSYSYSLNAAELISTGFYGSGAEFTTNFSGDLAYMSSSLSHPFSAVYDGGVLLANSDQPTTTYQELSLSQVYQTKNWNFEVQDAVSYMPESPAVGLSGIPGVGDLGVNPVPVGPQSGIGVLTDYGPRVSNTVTGTAGRKITPHVSAQVNGYYTDQRFIGDNASEGVDNDGEGGSAGVTYRFDLRDSLTGSFNYSIFDYPGTDYSYSAEGGTIDFSRQWSRRLSTDVYAGPQYLASTGVYTGPSSVQLQAGAGLAYAGRFAFYTLTYSRGAANGSGVLPGSFQENVTGAAHRQFGRKWNVSGSLGYSKSTTLPVFEAYTFSSNGVAAGGQVSRSFGRRISTYASYTVEQQSIGGDAAVLNAFNGVYQIFGIGVSFSGSSHPSGK